MRTVTASALLKQPIDLFLFDASAMTVMLLLIYLNQSEGLILCLSELLWLPLKGFAGQPLKNTRFQILAPKHYRMKKMSGFS
jgi:hypothetical protein